MMQEHPRRRMFWKRGEYVQRTHSVLPDLQKDLHRVRIHRQNVADAEVTQQMTRQRWSRALQDHSQGGAYHSIDISPAEERER